MKQKEKRNSLEQFLCEQILGPGAFNLRFFLLKKWQDNEFNGKRLKDCRPIDNVSEVISEVPAYQYSSGILFPNSVIVGDPKDPEPEIPINRKDEEELADNIKLDDEELVDEHFESISSRNQNYPNTCGLAFAVKPNHDFANKLSVTISYRTYKKLKQAESQENLLGYWVPDYCEEVEKIILEFYNEVLATTWVDGNLFVNVKGGVNMSEHLYTLDYINTERLLNTFLEPSLSKYFNKEDFFTPTTKTYDGRTFNFTFFAEEKLLEILQTKLRANPNTHQDFLGLITTLEIFKRVKSIVQELKTIYRASSMKNYPTPIWESKSQFITVTLKKPDAKKRIERGEIELEPASKLVLKYQYVRYTIHSGEDRLYIKLILVNTHEINLKPEDPPQLNKKDEANEKAFFGVKLQLAEIESGVIMPYNPPTLLDIDEEDNYNKLVYRQYKDYGEGYNTSVSWAIQNDNISVSTEFLPNQETPKIDFKPSKLVNDLIVPRINEEILSIRRLSTLSSIEASQIITDLRDFVAQYKVWIDEKIDFLKDSQVYPEGKHILLKQLKACEIDYGRLKRNIDLLANDSSALTAFRVMNTAMFMQLHHGVSIRYNKKKDGSFFVPDENTSKYYASLTLAEEYKWRAFQLAFILLNVDGFVKPSNNDLIPDVFHTGWPERNEIADLVWFPTGGGKTEAYLGIIAFAVCYRRFNKGDVAGGTTVLMRYTLRLLTLQQFQRATLLICALESIRYNKFSIPDSHSLGAERITIGLFVGSASLPNNWEKMNEELIHISDQLKANVPPEGIKSNLPFTDCPWCGAPLFITKQLSNVHPFGGTYGINDNMNIMCNSLGCTFNHRRALFEKSLPMRLFDSDIYKSPPTLLFGTVDKFASLANKVSTSKSERDQDSRRLFGGGLLNFDPPDLIIQDELHLLLGPLGSAVALYEKAIDELCTKYTSTGPIKPKVITSTATTRNTDKQIFALFNRRSEIFPKQGIDCDDSFFAYYERKVNLGQIEYLSNRKYWGILPIGKTQVWMQLRVSSIVLTHRLKFIKQTVQDQDCFLNSSLYKEYRETFDYYYTLLSYFNSLKEVGKTQSQLSHYLPGDVNLITKNTTEWSFLDQFVRDPSKIVSSELTGRLTGEEVKTNLSSIEKSWDILKVSNPPDLVVATNMISVGIDVSRFNTMIITSMPRNTAEYIQASSRVARSKEGIVLTVHHPFRSRDISHYQKFKEFHEKFYSYVEPISVTPFAHKALERYFAMFMAALIRHDEELGLSNNQDAGDLTEAKIERIVKSIYQQLDGLRSNASELDKYLHSRKEGLNSTVNGIFEEEELTDSKKKVIELMVQQWFDRLIDHPSDFRFRDDQSVHSLFEPRVGISAHNNWKVKNSLREIAPSAIIKTVQQ